MSKTYTGVEGKWIDNPEPQPKWWKHPNDWLKWRRKVFWVEEPAISSDDWNRMAKENNDAFHELSDIIQFNR
jgi:hypothetical protein